MSIYPLYYEKGENYYHVYTASKIKLFTINMNMANPEEIARTIVESVNKRVAV